MTARLRVVLDGRWLRVDSGIGQYGFGLATALPAVAPDLDLHVLLPPGGDPLVRALASGASGVRPVPTVRSPRSLGGAVEAAALLWRLRPSVYHAPDWMALPPCGRAWRTVTTIHDLIPLVAPEQVPRSSKARHPRVYRAALGALARRSDAVLTDAGYWADEIHARLGVERERVHAVPLGVKPAPPVAPEAVRAVRERLGLGADPYLLHVGRPEPYKGLVPLIRAFAAAAGKERLVIAGALDPRYPQAFEARRALGLEERVRIVGPVSQDDLEALFAGAALFVTLSRIEGFGLPPLEAMARSVPVVATRSTVFPEVLGDAALLVDPDDADAVTAALRAALDDEGLRARLVGRGLERAASYTWERCAAATAEVYRAVGRRIAPSASPPQEGEGR